MIRVGHVSLIALGLSACLALAGCGGADSVASPGEGSFAGGGGNPTNPTNPTTPTPGTPATDCPTGFLNVGTVANNTLRNCQLPAAITGSLVVPLRDGTVYSVSGRVDVGQDQGGDANAPIAGRAKGVLTVEAGVKVFGSAGLDYIVVKPRLADLRSGHGRPSDRLHVEAEHRRPDQRRLDRSVGRHRRPGSRADQQLLGRWRHAGHRRLRSPGRRHQRVLRRQRRPG